MSVSITATIRLLWATLRARRPQQNKKDKKRKSNTSRLTFSFLFDLLFSLFVQIALDTPFWRLLEFFFLNVDGHNLLVGRELFIKIYLIQLHDVADVLFRKIQLLCFLVVRMNQSLQAVVTLYDDALANHQHRVELVFYLFRIDVLAVGAEKHVLFAAFDEDVALGVDNAKVACMIPAFGIEGFFSGLSILVIAQHDVLASCQYLTRDVLRIATVNLNFHIDNSSAARAGSEGLPIGEGDDGCALSSSIAYADGEVEAVEEALYFAVTCCHQRLQRPAL